MYRWFGFLGLKHPNWTSLNLLPLWNILWPLGFEESIHHPVNIMTLNQRKEYLLHEYGLIQEVLLLFPHLGSFLKNGLIFYTQNRPLNSFLYIAFFWETFISSSWKFSFLILHGISFFKGYVLEWLFFIFYFLVEKSQLFS